MGRRSVGWDVDRVPVSVVIPAFNEAHRLPWSLPVLTDALGLLPDAELIIVDDGSTDGTSRVAAELLRDVPNSQVIRLPWNNGKGAAVRVGVAAADGDAIVFMDADLASDVGDLPILLAALDDAEVALGSRRLGRGANRAATRRLGSWAFNQLTRSLVSLDVADTQCGFKAFRRAEAKVLFGLSQANGFGFDVEVLSLARSLGYRIAEIPVRWSEEPGGTFRIIRHTPAMLAELARARRHARRSTAGGSPILTAYPSEGLVGGHLAAAGGTHGDELHADESEGGGTDAVRGDAARPVAGLPAVAPSPARPDGAKPTVPVQEPPAEPPAVPQEAGRVGGP